MKTKTLETKMTARRRLVDALVDAGMREQHAVNLVIATYGVPSLPVSIQRLYGRLTGCGMPEGSAWELLESVFAD